MSHFARAARVARERLDRALQFAKAGKSMRPVGLKPWSVVLFHEIMPTILGEVDIECLISKRGCDKK